MTSDSQLLLDYFRTNSQEAFGELVRRHVNLVYSTALRLTGGDAHLAQDVAQTVFTDLARKAGALSKRESLSGWLYTGARYAAAKAARAEHRRRDREELFMRDSSSEPVSESDWESIRPVLDEAMHELKEPDREAVVLRYFENRAFAEIGARLGLNENAARMRVERALAKLHAAFTRRGIATTAALASLISTHAVQLAPSGLAATLTTASLAGAGTGTLTFIGLMTTKLKLGLSALLIAGAATTIVIQHQAQAKLRVENEALRQQLGQLNAALDNQPALAAANPAEVLPDAQFRELLRLRGEVGVLRRQTNELTQLLAHSRGPKGQSSTRTLPTPGVDELPRTADGATKNILEAMSRGEWDSFFERFGEPEVPRDLYDKAFNENVRSMLAGLEIVSVGQPTNSFGPNMWFVPYKIRFKDGTEKENRLHVALDAKSQRWYFKGGF